MLIGVNYEVASKGRGKVWRVFKDIDKGRKDSVLVEHVIFRVDSFSALPSKYRIGHAFFAEGDVQFVENSQGEEIAIIKEAADVNRL